MQRFAAALMLPQQLTSQDGSRPLVGAAFLEPCQQQAGTAGKSSWAGFIKLVFSPALPSLLTNHSRSKSSRVGLKMNSMALAPH